MFIEDKSTIRIRKLVVVNVEEMHKFIGLTENKAKGSGLTTEGSGPPSCSTYTVLWARAELPPYVHSIEAFVFRGFNTNTLQPFS